MDDIDSHQIAYLTLASFSLLLHRNILSATAVEQLISEPTDAPFQFWNMQDLPGKCGMALEPMEPPTTTTLTRVSQQLQNRTVKTQPLSRPLHMLYFSTHNN